MLFLLFVALAGLLCADYLICMNLGSTLSTILQGIILLLAFVAAITAIFVLALQANFDNTIRQTIKNAFLLAMSNLPRSLFILLIHALPAIVLIFAPELFYGILPLWTFLFPALAAYFSTKLIRKILIPLMPPEEPDQSLLDL